MNNENSLLIRALQLNALFSGSSALIMIVSASWIAAQLGLEQPLLVYVTAGLLGLFSLQLHIMVRAARIRRWEVVSIIVGDIAWVAASAVLVVVFFESISPAGLIIVDFVALAVLFFAIQQIRGLRRAVLTKAVAAPADSI